MIYRFASFSLACCSLVLPAWASPLHSGSDLDTLITQHAQANGIPEGLVHRVVQRESRYNARATSRGNYGLMQIRHGTARGMGYSGSASGLLDANTNLTYAVPYLAAAYRVAGGNQNQAILLYARGFYQQAKRRDLNARRAIAQVARPNTQQQADQLIARVQLPSL
ncbi:MAG: lytic transglycosylase domain-containing protein [Methylobacterium sp.]|uniref:lytic transglycosylase domain-containing protein n=1 Tax=Methylobacterium sp. TaxID=409 RepID=UPI0025D66DF9|nr:lytic transglycosylase domain-containing protein [Methylobacterium sp.]MBX9933738.1 lytic transglycosylase domain-containing protein [Methylobacterium sp.]